MLSEVDAVKPEDRPALSIPIHILLGEAIDLVGFVRDHWDATDEHPGLGSVAVRFDDRVGGDMRALVDDIQLARTALRLAADTADSREEVERGREVLDELSAVLEFYFDDGVWDEKDAQLAAVAASETRTDDGLATALHDYAGLAEAHQGAVAGLGGFDVALIGEARGLGTSIRERSARSKSDREKEAIRHRARRDQLITVLDRKMKLVRSAARFVFRRKPALLQKSASTYIRRRRAEARRRGRAEAEDNTPTPNTDDPAAATEME